MLVNIFFTCFNWIRVWNKPSFISVYGIILALSCEVNVYVPSVPQHFSGVHLSLRVKSRNTLLSLGWSIQRPANICGSVPLSIMLSSASVDLFKKAPVDQASFGWDPDSDTG